MDCGLGAAVLTSEMARRVLRAAARQKGGLTEAGLQQMARAMAGEEILKIANVVFKANDFRVPSGKDDREKLLNTLISRIKSDRTGRPVSEIVEKAAMEISGAQKDKITQMITDALDKEGLAAAGLTNEAMEKLAEVVRSEVMKARGAMTAERIDQALKSEAVRDKVIELVLG